MLRMKKREITYKKLISQGIPDVPVCYDPVCFSSLLPENGMLFYREAFISPPPPPCFFIYLNDQRMPSAMLLDQHSLVFSGLEYFWDILHWCNGSGPWSLKAKEKYCTFRYIALFAWPSVAWDNYPSCCKLRPPHPRTNALSIDWNCSPCVLPLALPPSRLPLAHTGNFLGLEISLLFCE